MFAHSLSTYSGCTSKRHNAQALPPPQEGPTPMRLKRHPVPSILQDAREMETEVEHV